MNLNELTILKGGKIGKLLKNEGKSLLISEKGDWIQIQRRYWRISCKTGL